VPKNAISPPPSVCVTHGKTLLKIYRSFGQHNHHPPYKNMFEVPAHLLLLVIIIIIIVVVLHITFPSGREKESSITFHFIFMLLCFMFIFHLLPFPPYYTLNFGQY
jgi:hypothetical protein